MRALFQFFRSLEDGFGKYGERYRPRYGTARGIDLGTEQRAVATCPCKLCGIGAVERAVATCRRGLTVDLR